MSATHEDKLFAGAMALGMVCALYRARALPEHAEPIAREILQRSGDLARIEDERDERSKATA